MCGGSASGKTTVAKNIIEGIDIPWVVLLSMDSFYKGIVTDEDKKLAETGDYNFDHPDAFDWAAVSPLNNLNTNLNEAQNSIVQSKSR